MSDRGGSLPNGGSAKGDFCLGVVSDLVGGTSPPINRITDKSKIITFPQLGLRTVIMWQSSGRCICQTVATALRSLQRIRFRHLFLPAPMKFREGNVSSCVCPSVILSVHRGGVSVQGNLLLLDLSVQDPPGTCSNWFTI